MQAIEFSPTLNRDRSRINAAKIEAVLQECAATVEEIRLATGLNPESIRTGLSVLEVEKKARYRTADKRFELGAPIEREEIAPPPKPEAEPKVAPPRQRVKSERTERQLLRLLKDGPRLLQDLVAAIGRSSAHKAAFRLKDSGRVICVIEQQKQTKRAWYGLPEHRDELNRLGLQNQLQNRQEIMEFLAQGPKTLDELRQLGLNFSIEFLIAPLLKDGSVIKDQKKQTRKRQVYFALAEHKGELEKVTSVPCDRAVLECFTPGQPKQIVDLVEELDFSRTTILRSLGRMAKHFSSQKVGKRHYYVLKGGEDKLQELLRNHQQKS